jgi:dienelactone hydrolase
MKKIFFPILICLATIARGQFQVGHMSLNFKDGTRTGGYLISGGIQMPGTGRDIGTEVYYPATTAGNNVAVASGTFPVVIIGHGFAMDWSSYDNLYNRLAALGYIVALPRTEGSLSPAHADFGADMRLLGSLMLSLNTSTLSGTTTFNTKVSPKTAIGGHSMGAGCSYLASSGNSTITCLFNFAAATTNPSSISSASLATIPTLLVSGQRDCVADTTVQNSHYAALASSKKFHVILKDLTHCDFGNGSNFNCTFGQGTSGCGNTLSNSMAFNRYMTYLEPFLANQLKDNCNEGNRFMDSLLLPSSLRVGRKITGSIASAVAVIISGQTSVCSGSQATLTASGASTYSWSGGISNGVAFTPSVGQTYSVTATNSLGCSKTFTTGLTVNSTPTVTAASSASLLCNGSSAILTATGASTYSWTSGPGTSSYAVSPTANTTYTVTGTNAGGCSHSTTITQSVSTSSINLSITGIFTVCAGGATSLTASGASSYAWAGGITNGTSFTPLATQSYTVTATNVAGCSTTSVTTVTVNQRPPVTAASSASMLCSGSSATLTAAGATSYTWNGGQANTAYYIVSPTATTVYSVTGKDANGCQNSATITQSVSLCSGIYSSQNDQAIRLFPNPTEGKLFIYFDLNTTEPITLQCFDISGKLLWTEIINVLDSEKHHEFNFSRLDSGMYFLNVAGKGYAATFKVIKQ